MRRFLHIAFWLAVSGVLAVIFLARHEKPEYVESLETSVTGNIRTDHVDRIWFSPNGELVGIGLNESQLIVRVWSGGAANPIRERTLSLPAKPVYAVSGDASQAAWIDPTGVHVASLLPPKREKTDDLRSSRSVPVLSLAFTGSGKIAALYQDGELEIVDVGGGRVVASTHLDVADPARLIASGSYLAAYSSANGNAYVFDTAGNRFGLIEHKKYPRDILTMTLSPQARFAVATLETIEQPDRSIPTPGPVRSFAFFDRDRVLAAGDFQGIYLLGSKQGPQQVADVNPGTTALATTAGSLAFGNGSSLALASSRLVESRVSKGGLNLSPWLLIALVGLLTAVLIYIFYDSLALIIRKALKLSLPETVVAKKPAEEELIPKALVEACQNGDCVLWAGSGLGAQAGLPTWTVFVPELAYWAAEQGLAPTGIEDHTVADRVTAAFETREQPLHDYLRQRFRVSSEVSDAHRLAKEIDFQAVVTTSLDNLLDRAFPYSGGRVYTATTCEDLFRRLAHREFFLLKPFGDLDEPDTCRIGPAQCAQSIKDNPAVSEVMQELFRTRVFLFIGASLEGLERDLATLRLPPPEAKHYALVPTTDQGWEATAGRLRQRYAIEPLTYSPSTAQHPEIVKFLAALIELVRQRNYTPETYEAAR